MTAPAYIAYYRVSTDRQALSGLGLDAQRETVSRLVERRGGQLLAEYTEAESGRRPDRPQFRCAISAAKQHGATLVVARLDRLARNVAVMAGLLEAGINFVACDNPHANKLTIHILAAVAEYEADLISARTKAALAAAKKRGVRLGAQHPSCRGRRRGDLGLIELARKGREERQRRSATYRAALLPHVEALRTAGLDWPAVVSRLNAEGVRSRMGRPMTLAILMHQVIGRGGQPSADPCPTCGGGTILRAGRYGPTRECGGYPECPTRVRIAVDGSAEVMTAEPSPHRCRRCGQPLVHRSGRNGRYYRCGSCGWTCDSQRGLPVPYADAGLPCAKCGGSMVRRDFRGASYAMCAGYPDCSCTVRLDRAAPAGTGHAAAGSIKRLR
jgi:DNA invertase Pin-like site-specific DNA recombinase/ssDNA-binding Zn-finger/Zn-ribbon topoisomerase 1